MFVSSTNAGGGGGTTIPTLVAISSFAGLMEGGQALVEWKTSSEVGSAGFNLLRKMGKDDAYEPVNQRFLPALPHSPQGGVYRLSDSRAQFGDTVEYLLEEIEATGRTRTYGPFKVKFGERQNLLSWRQDRPDANLVSVASGVSGYQRFVHAPTAVQAAQVLARRQLQQQQRLQMQQRSVSLQTAQPTRVKIAVKGSGLYYLSAAQIAQSLGQPQQQVEALILAQNLALSTQGQAVAWLADKSHPGIYFYAVAINGIYSNEAIYWLEQGRGLALGAATGGAPNPVGQAQIFRAAVHAEEEHYALAALFRDPTADIWLWDAINAGDPAKWFAVHTDSPAGGGTATLTVHLKGATDTPADPDHHVQVSLNGRQLGGGYWNGLERYDLSIDFDQSLLHDGDNFFGIDGVLYAEVPYSLFYVDSLDLTYDKYYHAKDNRLLLRGDRNDVVTVDGFSDLNLMVWDVTQPLQPSLVSGATIGADYKVSFVPATPQSTYLVSSPAAALAPAWVRGVAVVDLKSNRNYAEYVIVAPEALKASAQDLAAFHQAKGLNAMVVGLEDIYDNFSWGIASPWAIKSFVAYAYDNWRGKKLQYVLLLGKGTYDYKDNLGFGDNLVPPLLAATPDGMFAADKLFGEIAGNGTAPEIAVGRLPVTGVEELQAVIAKIRAYDSASGPWTGDALLIADNAENGDDFLQQSDDLAALLSGLAVDRAYLGDGVLAAVVRQKILSRWNGGCGLVNYLGHAGLNQLATENILNIDDLAALANSERLPLVTLLSCVVGRFEIPGNQTLSEAMLLKANGGAIGVIAPTGTSINSQANLLAGELFKALYQSGVKDLGQAWLQAMKNYLALGGDPYLLNVYNILGDPALKVK